MRGTVVPQLKQRAPELHGYGIELDRVSPARECTSAHCAKSRRSGGYDRGNGRVRLCCPCYDRLRVNLGDVVVVYSESDHELSRPKRWLRERVSGSKESGITLDDTVLTLRSQIVELLTSWTRLVVEERRTTAPGDCSVMGLAGFLDDHVPWLAEHPAAPDFDHEIAVLLDVCQGLRGLAPTARRVPLGSCRRPGCAGELYAVMPGADVEKERSEVVCDSGHAVPPRDWLLLAGRLRQSARGRDE